MAMAVGKRSIRTGESKQSGAVNAITGNTISRDASSGRFYVIKDSDNERISVNEAVPKRYGKTSASNKGNEGGFTINKKKAEQAERAVLSYLNESDK